jgi:hypothetical protein
VVEGNDARHQYRTPCSHAPAHACARQPLLRRVGQVQQQVRHELALLLRADQLEGRPVAHRHGRILRAELAPLLQRRLRLRPAL